MLCLVVLFVLSLISNVHSQEDVEAELSSLKARIVELEAKTVDLIQHEEALKTALIAKNRNLDRPAFTVQLSQDQSLVDNTVVIFDDVVYDAMGDFNQLFGFFESPHDGAYYFSVCIQSPAAKKSQVVLRVTSGGVETRVMYIRTYMYDTVDSSGSHSNSVILRLNAGDEVSVITSGSGSTSGVTELLGSGPYTIFLGFEI